MATTSDFKTGLVIEFEGGLFSVLEYQHVKAGKGGALLKTKLRNVKTGQIIDWTFRAGEKINKAYIEEKKCDYLYSSDNLYFFMDQTSFEELVLKKEQVGSVSDYLKENTAVTIVMYKGEAIGLELPSFVELKVAESEPGVRGDTVSRTTKTARLETGAKMQVPLFVNTGDTVRVDTRKGEYVERVS